VIENMMPKLIVFLCPACGNRWSAEERDCRQVALDWHRDSPLSRRFPVATLDPQTDPFGSSSAI
jgi:hypothetical protein